MIKYELVFDEGVEGEYLREKILPKTVIQEADHAFLQEDEDEMAEVQDESACKDVSFFSERETNLIPTAN